MLSALRLVLSGGVYLPMEILDHAGSLNVGDADSLTSGTGAHGKTPAELGLTDRQMEVLDLLLQGKSNKLICRELGLAEGTVKIHITAVLKALNVTSRTQAVIAASQIGLRVGAFGKS